MSSSSMFRVLLVCGLVVCAWTAEANAGYISVGGDFGSGWSYSGFASSNLAQSPFTNAFSPSNSNGMATDNGVYYYPYVYQTFTPTAGGGFLYLNGDFKVNSYTDHAGALNFVTANGWGNFLTAVVVKSDGLFAVSSTIDNGNKIIDNGSAIFTPQLDEWYNVQLTLNMTGQSYSGTVIKYSPTGNTLAGTISDRPFISTQSVVDRIYQDTNAFGPGAGSNPGWLNHYVDNFVISNTPVPEPGTLALLTTGLLGLLAYALRKRYFARGCDVFRIARRAFAR